MFDNQKAFVTGGTGAVGAAIVRCLAERGAEVAFSFHTKEDMARQLEKEMAARDLTVKGYALDLTDASGVVLTSGCDGDAGGATGVHERRRSRPLS